MRKDEDKCILYKGDVVGTLNDYGEPENNVNTNVIQVWLLKNVNTLKVLICRNIWFKTRLQSNITNGEVVGSGLVIIENFPLQRGKCKYKFKK